MMENEVQDEHLLTLSYETAEKLRTSRRVLFEKVARSPREHLTVLTGFNSYLLLAFAWECCVYLERNSPAWQLLSQPDDDCFDWLAQRDEFGLMLDRLYKKTSDEIYHMEWNINMFYAFQSLLKAKK